MKGVLPLKKALLVKYYNLARLMDCPDEMWEAQ